jgi:nitrate reductase gamma subunit
MAFNEIGNYDLMMLLHVLFGEIMLVVIPFSKLGHMLLFFFTRAYIGMEMGARREMDGRLGGRVW